MLLFERTEKKLEIALKYINSLHDYAEKNNKENLKKSVEKVLEEIKKI